MTWNTLPERHILDRAREAAGIRVDVIGKWFVVMEGERDTVWFLQADKAETFADELAADAVEAGMVGAP